MGEIKFVGSRILSINANKSKKVGNKEGIKVKIENIVPSFSKETKEILEVSYSFEVNYGSLGMVEIKGEVYLSSDEASLKKIQESFKNKGKLSKEQSNLTNLIFQKASLKALKIEDELGLPPHIKLPVLSVQEN